MSHLYLENKYLNKDYIRERVRVNKPLLIIDYLRFGREKKIFPLKS